MSGGLAVVTGASTGIGLELARILAADGHDLLIAADEPEIEIAAGGLSDGVEVEALDVDLATARGVEELWAAIGSRPVDVLCANAGVGLGHAFLDQEWNDIARVIDTNVSGTTALLHRAARQMAAAGAGRILITGSISGLMPGSFQVVYNGTKAYLDTLSWALRNELGDSGVTVTCLMPGPTETEFFSRAGMDDTPVGRDDKADAAKVARAGYDAMIRGASGVTPGAMTKLQAAMAGILPDSVTAAMHRRMAEPGRSS